MTPRMRADLLLVERGLFESRARAQDAIAAGLVTADGAPVRKASEGIAPDAVIEATPPHPWVSRGGVKLAAALDRFGIDPAGRICLDIGASTGGFTDVLRARGAAHVFAIDVGHGQMHKSLRDRSNITVLEGTDIRTVTQARLAPAPDLVVADVSFISLKLVLPAALGLATAKGELVALIKPQFEAGRAQLKKGILRDEALQDTICADISGFIESLGWRVLGIIPSPITGGDGNREFLIGARHG